MKNDDDLKIFNLESDRWIRHDFPTVSLRHNRTGILNRNAHNLLESGGITFARDKDGYLFICFLPKTSEIRGLKVTPYKSFSAKRMLSYLEIESGLYKIEVEEQIFKSNLVWYPLTKM